MKVFNGRWVILPTVLVMLASPTHYSAVLYAMLLISMVDVYRVEK